MTRLPILFTLLMLTHAQAADAPPGELRQGDCQRPKPGQDLRHCSFAGRNLPGIDLSSSRLDGVDFSNARMPGCPDADCRMPRCPASTPSGRPLRIATSVMPISMQPACPFAVPCTAHR